MFARTVFSHFDDMRNMTSVKSLALSLVLLLLFISSGTMCSAQSQPPVPRVFYSDLDSGPGGGGQNNKGAFVTIYGSGFGAIQSSSTVSVGGGLADNYPVWTNNKISFQLGSAAKSGDIVVTVNSTGSNGVPFTVRAGNIFFVSNS